jgi:hypothetical protein
MKRSLPYIFVVATLTTSLRAALTYDGFNYTVGTALSASTDWDALNSGTAPVIASGNLSVTGLAASTGNKVTFAAGNIQEAVGLLDSYTVGTVYYSFAFDLTAAPTATTYSFLIGNSGSNFGATVWLQAATGGYNIGLANKSNSTPNYSSTVYALNDVVFLVGSYEFVTGAGNDVSNLWINPTATTFGTVSAPTATLTAVGGTDLASINQFIIRGANGSPAGEIDELRVGSSWASVTPVAVPEPASAVLGAFGLLALLRRRRR